VSCVQMEQDQRFKAFSVGGRGHHNTPDYSGEGFIPQRITDCQVFL
jgi:hypothetical protein